MLMEKELKYLIEAVEHPARPMACIVGGAKVSCKVRTRLGNLAHRMLERLRPVAKYFTGAVGVPPQVGNRYSVVRGGKNCTQQIAACTQQALIGLSVVFCGSD